MTDLPSTVCVLQYADDILVSGETKEDCEKASIIVCNVLAQAGFKALKDKLQWVQSKVTYLGHIIMPGLRAISTDSVQMIRKMKPPQTVQQLQSFLGLVNYGRSWIPDCAIYDRHLRNLIDHKAPPSTLLKWTEETELHFTALKQAITMALALGLPNYSRDFHLHVCEVEGVALGVLLQQHGSTYYRPLAYLSKKLDNSFRYASMPSCCGCGCSTCTDGRKNSVIASADPLYLSSGRSYPTQYANTAYDSATTLRLRGNPSGYQKPHY